MDDARANTGKKRPLTLPAEVVSGFLDAVPAATAILDHRAEMMAVNAAWRRFAAENGGDPEGWRGTNYLWACSGDDPDARAVAEGISRVLAGLAPSFQHEYPCHGNGSERWFRCLVSALPSDRRGRWGVAVMHIDITAQKMSEARALAASRAKSAFLANLSHELRTPLNAVIGFSEMMMAEMWGPLDPRYHAYAGHIHEAGRHLLSLINEVLDLSKVEAGKFELHEEEVAVPDLLRQSLHLIQDRAERKGLVLAHHVAEPLPRLFADARLIRQILLNLLSNAIKFTPPGGLISVVAALNDDGWLRLAVTDSGIGIAADDIERVLEPFGQVDSDLARQHADEGTGLGLPLCKRFAELHGGRLLLDSARGKGTTMAVLLPPGRLRQP